MTDDFDSAVAEEGSDAARGSAAESEFDVFRYLNAEKEGLYRAIMHAFMEAKEQFAIHLKPEDLQRALRDGDPPAHCPSTLHEIEQALHQLREWGNLVAHADNAEVRTLEEFYRPRFLYQLSREGEAAERALAFYREQIEQPGELQATALADIEAVLHELQLLIGSSPRDAGKIHASFQALYARFEQLAARAQQFLGSVQRAIDLQSGDVQAFLAYKERLIDYLERFIGELVLKAPAIGAIILSLEAADMDEVLESMAERDLADALDPDEDAAARVRRGWIRRWQGLRAWFFGPAGELSQAERLRNRARSAIPDLLAVVSNLNERRVQRSDRSEDLRTLARWFAECESDEAAHRLWRAAFCLSPARHLTIDALTLDAREAEPTSPRTSWLDAEPLWIEPRLRATGRIRRFGKQTAIADHRLEKAELGRLLEAEQRQIEAARARIATGGPTRLAEFARLDRAAFGLFLDCLGAALGRKFDPAQTVETESSDGSLRIRLEPIPDAPWVTFETEAGRFSGHDHWVTIEEAFAEAPA